MKKRQRPDPEKQFPYSVEQSSNTQQPVEDEKETNGGTVKKWKIPSQAKRKLLPPRRS